MKLNDLNLEVHESMLLKAKSFRGLSVAYAAPGWPLESYANGIVTYIASIAQELPKLGHKSYVLTYNLDDSAESSRENNIVKLLPKRADSKFRHLCDSVHGRISPEMGVMTPFAYGLRQGVDKLLSNSKLDLLEIEESFGFAGLLKHFPIPIVVRLHGPWFLNGDALGAKKDRDFMRRVRNEGKAISKAFAISAPSQDVLERTRNYYNLPLEHGVVIPCPIAPTPGDQRWQLENCEQNLIVFVGRFDRHKGGDLVIDAFARILQKLPETRLIFAGPDSGYTDDNGRTWKIEEYIREKLPGALETKRIEWLGQVRNSVLQDLRRRARLIVIPSRYETFSYTSAEALSLGCPIVAARAGAIPELIQDGVSGLLFRSGDVEDFACQSIRLLKNPVLATQFARQAGEDCARYFAPEVIAKQSIEFYRKTLERWFQNKSE